MDGQRDRGGQVVESPPAAVQPGVLVVLVPAGVQRMGHAAVVSAGGGQWALRHVWTSARRGGLAGKVDD